MQARSFSIHEEMMRSLSTKVNKSRSPASAKIRKSKVKKASKPQRSARTVSARLMRKRSPAKAKKQTSPAKKRQAKTAKRTASKKLASKKPLAAKKAKASARRVAAKPVSRRVSPEAPAARRRRIAARAARIVFKPAPMPPKKSPTPATLAAVRGFEQALKVFNRHDFSTAKSAFGSIVDKFSDQAEIIARARTYLAICDQRLARTPSAPRNVDGLYNQGVFELNRGNVDVAIELFERALKSDPRADHVMYSLAAAYAYQNNLPKAVGTLTRAVAIRPVHRSHARSDLDFANLRGDEAFQQLTGYGFDLQEES